jgi:copper homeostasis protein
MHRHRALVGLEVPVFGGGAAPRAVQAGASRVEVNAAGSYPDGGLTPTLADLRQATSLDVPLRIMIRPRGPPPAPRRDFIYSRQELVGMSDAIAAFKESGLLDMDRGDGFVFGVLKQDAAADEDEGT